MFSFQLNYAARSPQEGWFSFFFFVYWFDYALLLLYFLLMENSIIKCEFTFFFLNWIQCLNLISLDAAMCSVCLCIYLKADLILSSLSLSRSLVLAVCLLFLFICLFIYCCEWIQFFFSSWDLQNMWAWSYFCVCFLGSLLGSFCVLLWTCSVLFEVLICCSCIVTN